MRLRPKPWLLAAVLLASPAASRADGKAKKSTSESAEVRAEDLLRHADRARGGLAEGITWTVDIKVREGAEEKEARSYLVKARGDDSLAEALAPAKNKGEILLFNDRALWFVKPGLRKPISLSTRQRLTGDAANGDIASTNYARDYDGALDGEERVNGESAYRLQLKARAGDVTYDRITYWVSKSRHLALKAEFRTVSNVVFKSATFTYGNKLKHKGEDLDLVTEMVITDAADESHVTTLRFKTPTTEGHPSSAFNINNVVR